VILVDSPIWIDHLRSGDAVLEFLLDQQRVLMHPFVKGEISLGHMRARAVIMRQLDILPPAKCARDDEVVRMIEAENLIGCGIGYVDAHLVASARLTKGARLLTRDKRLHAIAERLSIAARVVH
jgi:hypothetical protein